MNTGAESMFRVTGINSWELPWDRRDGRSAHSWNTPSGWATCLRSPPDWALYRPHILQTAEVPAGGDRQTITTLMLSQQMRPKATYRKTLSQHAGLLQFPWSTKFLHISAEVTVSTLGPNAGLTALTPAARRHVVSPECAAMLNSSTSRSLCTKI